MDLRRSSSFDQNQSREGRQERRDQTWFLRPERSRSLPPDLEKYRRQAAIESIKSLENQGVKLINGFNDLLKDLQQNTEDRGLSILPGESGSKVTVSESVRLNDDSGSSSGFTPMDREPNRVRLKRRTYSSLVQSYTIYKGSQFALEINKYLPVEHMNKIRCNGDKIEKLMKKAFDTLNSIDYNAFLTNLNDYSNNFIEESKNRNEFAKNLNSFLENIKINQTQNLPLSDEQVKTYKDLTSRSDEIFSNFAVFNFRMSQFKDYYNEEQQLQVKREVERISSISAEVDKTVQSIKLAPPTFRDLRSQRTDLAKRWYALLESYQEKKQHNSSLSAYEYEWNELRKIRQLIKDYEATTIAFENTEHAESLDKHQKSLLQLDKKMVQMYKSTIANFLASHKDLINTFLPEQSTKVSIVTDTP